MSDAPPPTPTLDKMLEVKETSQSIGEFLDWLREEADIFLAHYEDGDDRNLYEINDSIEQLLARYFGIGLDAAENEKRALLEHVRNAQ